MRMRRNLSIYEQPVIDIEVVYAELGFAGSLENPIEGDEIEW